MPVKLIAIGLMSVFTIPGFAEDVILRNQHQQPCYVVGNKQVEVSVTENGGHMAPVTFYRDSDQPVKPYYVSPWQDEKPSEMPV